MGFCKDLFMDAHEAAVEQYLEEHPEADWQDAYEATCDQAYHDMGDMMAGLADQQRQQMKDAR